MIWIIFWEKIEVWKNNFQTHRKTKWDERYWLGENGDLGSFQAVQAHFQWLRENKPNGTATGMSKCHWSISIQQKYWRFSWFSFMKNHPKSSAIIQKSSKNHQKSSAIIQKSSKNHQKSSTIMKNHQKSSTIINNHQQSSTFSSHPPILYPQISSSNRICICLRHISTDSAWQAVLGKSEAQVMCWV